MNKKRQKAREVALAILKPTKKDLEHGLELHSHSIVCDAYGFAPRSAVDSDAIKTAIKSGASEAELHEMIEDMSMTRCVTDPDERQEFLDAWKTWPASALVSLQHSRGR